MDFELPVDVPWFKNISLNVSHLWVVFVLFMSIWFFGQFIRGRDAMRTNLNNTQIMLERIQREMEKENGGKSLDIIEEDILKAKDEEPGENGDQEKNGNDEKTGDKKIK